MGKIAFIFSGQGAQYIGMGRSLVENIPCAKKVFSKASQALGFDMENLCFQGSKEELNKTENTQPAILTVSIAALRALEEMGIRPDVTAGLSLGEYSALVCSGALEFETAVKLVKKRGKFMQEAVPEGVGTMAAVLGLKPKEIREICIEVSNVGIVEPANFNCPGQIVIAGEIEAVKLACSKAKEKGAKRAILLSVSAPFHTSMLKPAAQKLEVELKQIEIKDMKVPVVTNVTAEFVQNSENIKAVLKKQVMSSVLWEDSIHTMVKYGVDTFVEIGPGKILSGFVKKIDRNLKIINVEDLETLNKAVDLLKKDF